MGTKKLRFAALIRVSTEKQEKQGESLRTQTTSSKDSVKFLGGEIVEWYGGQEHGMPGYEKKEVDRLIKDAHRKKFDAVIVTDADRWSRDNEKSREGLAVFSSHDVRFFVGVTEYNLFDPAHLLFLEMSAVIGKFYARNQKFKSISNRIHRARRGIPTGGKYPFGRKWDEAQEKWTIDIDKHTMVKDVAKRYLKGEKLSDLADEYGVNHSNLHKVLMHRSGDDWELRFESKEFKIDVVVPFKVPPLLDDRTIRALHAKAKANKTYHGTPKYQYVLSGLVYCEACGYKLQCQTNHHEDRYYRHPCRRGGGSDCPVTPRPWIRADHLEEAVLRLILDELCENPVVIRKAIEAATPNLEKLKELEQRRDRLRAEVQKIEKRKQRIVAAVADETFTHDHAKSEMEACEADQAQRTSLIGKIQSQIDNLPTPETIETAARQFVTRYGNRRRASAKRWAQKGRASRFETMTFEQKRELVLDVFQGVSPDGKPAGVYVMAIDNQPDHRYKRWKFKLLGNAAIDGFCGRTECVNESALC